MATASLARNTFLWRGALLGPFVGPRARQCRTSGPAHAAPSPTVGVSHCALGPVRLPQPQPRLASRARRRSPDSATLSTRNPSTPTGDHSSHEELLSRPSSPDPTEIDPSCEQHGTGTSPFRKKPRLVPRRYLPYRPRRSELAVRAATQRPTRPRLEHPVVAG